jgi:hypothetical protein
MACSGASDGPCQAMRNRPIDDFGTADAAYRHRLRVHADVGETGNGIDLVDNELQVRCQKEIDARHATAALRDDGRGQV